MIRLLANSILLAGLLAFAVMLTRYITVRECSTTGQFEYSSLVYQCSVRHPEMMEQNNKKIVKNASKGRRK